MWTDLLSKSPGFRRMVQADEKLPVVCYGVKVVAG